MTAITRKTSNYSKRLKRAEKKKVGRRQGRIIDLDGFLVFPEEMKQIRKASKLSLRAGESADSSPMPLSFPWPILEMEQIVAELPYDFVRLRLLALKAKKDLGIARPANARVRVGLSYRTCGAKHRYKLAHCHCYPLDGHYGRICVSPEIFKMSVEDIGYVMAHEVLHFRHGRIHTRTFWGEQNKLVLPEYWNALISIWNGNARTAAVAAGLGKQ